MYKQAQKPSETPTIKAKLRGEVVTADTRGAGTDAKVTLWVTDVNGKVIGPMLVREEGKLYKIFLSYNKK